MSNKNVEKLEKYIGILLRRSDCTLIFRDEQYSATEIAAADGLMPLFIGHVIRLQAITQLAAFNWLSTLAPSADENALLGCTVTSSGADLSPIDKYIAMLALYDAIVLVQSLTQDEGTLDFSYLISDFRPPRACAKDGTIFNRTEDGSYTDNKGQSFDSYESLSKHIEVTAISHIGNKMMGVFGLTDWKNLSEVPDVQAPTTKH